MAGCSEQIQFFNKKNKNLKIYSYSKNNSNKDDTVNNSTDNSNKSNNDNNNSNNNNNKNFKNDNSNRNNNNSYNNNSTISKTSKSNKKMVIWMTLGTDPETRYTQSSVWPRRGLK